MCTPIILAGAVDSSGEQCYVTFIGAEWETSHADHRQFRAPIGRDGAPMTGSWLDVAPTANDGTYSTMSTGVNPVKKSRTSRSTASHACEPLSSEVAAIGWIHEATCETSFLQLVMPWTAKDNTNALECSHNAKCLLILRVAE